MASRKPGTVVERKDRDGYEARVTLPDGRRPTKYVSTKKQGWDWVSRTLADAQRGTLVIDDKRKTGDYLANWLDGKIGVKANSLYNYRLCISYVLPHIGNTRLCDLKPPQIKSSFSKLATSKSAETLNLTHRILKSALEDAVDDEILSRNPMRRMKAPHSGTGSRHAMTLEECRAVIQASEGTRWHTLFLLMATSGLRIGECLGLRWSDVDLDSGQLRVQTQAQRIHGEKGVHLVEVKTASSRRPIILPPVTRRALRQHKATQGEEELKCPPDLWRGQDLLFCSRLGVIYYRSAVDVVFKRIANSVGIEDATPHTFRHTVSTLLQSTGNPVTVAQALLGHSRPSMTLDVYSHTTKDALERAAVTLESLFGEKEKPLTTEAG